jgi:hypothetical protein
MTMEHVAMIRMLTVLTVVLAATGGVALAADDGMTRDGDRLALDTVGHTVTMPVPAWGEGEGGDDLSALQLVRTDVSPTAEVTEVIPADEDINSWTRMIAALTVNSPEYTAAAHEDNLISSFEQGCVRDTLQMGTAMPEDGDLARVVVIACGEYQPGLVGTAEGMGEVLIASLFETSAGAVKIYQVWRGPAFDLNDQSTWPVAQDELSNAMMAFHAIAAAEAN